jgi:hypothetical protein
MPAPARGPTSPDKPQALAMTADTEPALQDGAEESGTPELPIAPVAAKGPTSPENP